MGESLHGEEERAAEFAREQALDRVVREYCPEDREFLSELDLGDRIGAVYGTLVAMELDDPDAVLTEAGVLEGSR